MSQDMMRRLRAALAPSLLWAVALAVLLIARAPGLAAVGAWLLTIALPGYLAGRVVLGRWPRLTQLERWLLSLGLGYAICLVSTLLLHYLPGPLTRRTALIGYNGLVLCLLLHLVIWLADEVAGWYELPRLGWANGLLVLGLVALVAVPRLVNLGYAEFQGDEVAVLHKAAAAIQGREDALFLHKKGPAEILLPMASYALARRTSELAARLPFALASCLSVAALYAIAARWCGARARKWAALLLAIAGFSVAFGRIVQYQSLVLLFGLLVVLLAAATEHRLATRYLALVAVLVALGLWAHTDAAFVALPVAVLVVLDVWRAHRAEESIPWLALGGAGALGLALLALFYLPFVRHPHFSATAEYLAWRGGGQPPYNNLRAALDLAAVYHAVYYLAFLAIILLAAVRSQREPRSRRRLVLGGALAGLLLVAAWRLSATPRWQALALFSALMLWAVLLGDVRASLTWRVTVAWFAVPLALYLFWFRDPRTHLYVSLPAACLLVGAELAEWLRRPWRKSWCAWLGVGAALTLSGLYIWLLFVGHTLEYKRTFPASRWPLFWTPYGQTMPEQGLFGFPYQAGWKVIGHLYQDGVLHGDLGSNEEAHIVRWYTRGREPNVSQPQYYVIARDVQDEQAVPWEEIAAHYALVGRVWVGQEAKISLYERQPVRLAYQDYVAADWASRFDAEATAPDYDQGLPLSEPPTGIAYSAELYVGDGLVFLGHAVSQETAEPGGDVVLTLYWRVLEPDAAQAYTTFTHVEDPGVVWGQKDKPFATDVRLAAPDGSALETHQFILCLADDAPVGPHALVAGVYRSQTGERLPVRDRQGADLGTVLPLGVLIIVD
jgi:lipid-A-disaccharide synthase-like uncharacterized protein